MLELLSEGGEAAFDTMCLLRTLGQVRTDMVDRKQAQTINAKAEKDISEMKGKNNISKVKIRHTIITCISFKLICLFLYNLLLILCWLIQINL